MRTHREQGVIHALVGVTFTLLTAVLFAKTHSDQAPQTEDIVVTYLCAAVAAGNAAAALYHFTRKKTP
jgi:hypothetical protein